MPAALVPALAGLMLCFMVSPTQAAPMTTPVRAEAVQPQAAGSFYRLYNPGNGDHFHTTNFDEVLSAIQDAGYRYEGVGAKVR